jgi:hypothetical protein
LDFNFFNLQYAPMAQNSTEKLQIVTFKSGRTTIVPKPASKGTDNSLDIIYNFITTYPQIDAVNKAILTSVYCEGQSIFEKLFNQGGIAFYRLGILEETLGVPFFSEKLQDRAAKAGILSITGRELENTYQMQRPRPEEISSVEKLKIISTTFRDKLTFRANARGSVRFRYFDEDKGENIIINPETGNKEFFSETLEVIQARHQEGNPNPIFLSTALFARSLLLNIGTEEV